MELDPEKNLWLPNRRSFFFFGAAAGLGALLPEITSRISATEAMMPLWMSRPYTERQVVQWLASVQEMQQYGHLMMVRTVFDVSPVQAPQPRPRRVSESSALPLPLMK